MKPGCQGNPVGHLGRHLVLSDDVPPVPGVGLPGERLVNDGVLEPGLLTGASHHSLLLGQHLGPVQLVSRIVPEVLHLIVIENVAEHANKRRIMLDVKLEGSKSEIAVIVVKMLTLKKFLLLC